MQYLIIAAIVIAIRLIIAYFKKDKKGVVVLGKELAQADEKERQRVETGNYQESPLPGFNYRKWKDEQSLINPSLNELDLGITDLCLKFNNCEEHGRDEIRNSLNQNNIYTLLEFARRATVFAIRANEAKYIYDGFSAISMIDSERCDFRDVLVALSFLNHATQKLNLNAKEIFENTIKSSDSETGALIKGFYEKNQKNNNIERMAGYAEVNTPYGAGFVTTYLEKYKPEKNLVKILFEISKYLATDKYQSGSITIATSIAPVWFGAYNDKNIERLIRKANGCASLSSVLKEGLDMNSSEQYLDIYLAEFSDLNAMDNLNERPVNSESASFASLCFCEENLLCMIIQRAIRQGLKDYETDESLKRFEDKIRKIIASVA